MTSAVRIEDPASIVAASICWLARWAESGHNAAHPGPCGWCDYPQAVLLAAMESFDHGGWPARQFRGLAPSARARLVAEAQELEPADPDVSDGARVEPMAAIAAAPADEETVPWL